MVCEKSGKNFKTMAHKSKIRNTTIRLIFLANPSNGKSGRPTDSGWTRHSERAGPNHGPTIVLMIDFLENTQRYCTQFMGHLIQYSAGTDRTRGLLSVNQRRTMLSYTSQFLSYYPNFVNGCLC